MSSLGGEGSTSTLGGDNNVLVISKRDLLRTTGHQGATSSGKSCELVLASQSPRRREILSMMGLAGRFRAIPSPLDESALQKELKSPDRTAPMPDEYTRILAEQKALALAQSMANADASSKTLILGSDTVVDLDGIILEKPVDVADAIGMLSAMSGRWHKVHTGVALYAVDNKRIRLMESFTDTAMVEFATLDSRDIQAYVATGEPMDKAGSYGIQGVGGQLVQRMEGDFFTVMGLPMYKTSLALSRALDKLLT